MYANLNDAIAREHRSDLRSEAAEVRSGRRGRPSRRRGRGTRTDENHSVATVVRSLGRPFVAFQNWYAAGEL